MNQFEVVYNAFRMRLARVPTFQERNYGAVSIHDVLVDVCNRTSGYTNPVFIKVEVIVEGSKRKGSRKVTYTLTTEAEIEAVVEKVAARCEAMAKENLEHDAKLRRMEKQRKAKDATIKKLRKALYEKGFDPIIEADSQGNVARLNFYGSDAQKVYDMIMGGL